jgi:hypothetical protein
VVRKKRRGRRKSDHATAGQKGANLPPAELPGEAPAGLSSDPKMLISVLVGGVAFAVYLLIFYSTPLSFPGIDELIVRGDVTLWLFM